MTFHRTLAAHNFGRIASALLTLAMVIQPVKVTAQTVSGLEISPDLAVSDDNPLSTQGEVPAPEPVPPTAQKILLDVCQNHGYGEGCGKALLGMMWKESNNIATAVGDHGLALGYFQIHYRMHKVTRACATDLGCSAEWTIKYMERNGYPKNVAYAVQCHNSCGFKNGYAASALRHGDRLWSVPMTVEVALAK
jgi:hypothetical protein